MDEKPRLEFLSLFVRDLQEARTRYEAMFGMRAMDAHPDVPKVHPFASSGPVVFDLGGVKLALYQCDMRATHPGDVGLGVAVDGSPAALANRAAVHGARVFFGPQPLADDPRSMAVFVSPDRHFFEVVGKDR